MTDIDHITDTMTRYPHMWKGDAIRWGSLFLKPAWYVGRVARDGKLTLAAYKDYQEVGKANHYDVNPSDLKRGWTPERVLAFDRVLNYLGIWNENPTYETVIDNYNRYPSVRDAVKILTRDNWHKILCCFRFNMNWPASHIPMIKGWIQTLS
jgi:hypothetical protein